jgi:hypothetical protein
MKSSSKNINSDEDNNNIEPNESYYDEDDEDQLEEKRDITPVTTNHVF